MLGSKKTVETTRTLKMEASFDFNLCPVQIGEVPVYKTNSHPSCPGFPPPALYHGNSQLRTFPSSLTFVSAIQQFLPGSSSLFTPCELILLAAALAQAAMAFFPSPNVSYSSVLKNSKRYQVHLPCQT